MYLNKFQDVPEGGQKRRKDSSSCDKVANESYEKALSEEGRLFETHVLLSKMDKSMVSIPVLAHKLVQIQANIIFKCFPDIVKEINDKLAVNVVVLSEFPQHSGLDEYSEDFETQCAAKWFELHDLELKQHSAKKKVTGTSETAEEFVGKFWNYIEEVIVKVMMHHSDSHQELQYFLRRSVKNLIARRKGESVKSIRGITGADRLTDLTRDPEYVATCTMLMAQKKKFVKFCKNSKGGTKIDLEGFGVIDVLYLRRHPRHVVKQAFELKMMIAAYWKKKVAAPVSDPSKMHCF
ncbi:hypothetical protein CQW23_27044 [Capsicum baccatum]|uniref:Dynamin stalk domain-containing protein n=1 Tax=Capsicum baccatum TaxID=33114 RepID=A0A2G2VQI9_CAPBA|nr:hypothetical protein CQW23_27044 [Capsicum baccatum]